VFNRICGSAGAPIKAPVCRIMREGFSLSGGRIEDFVGACGATYPVIPHAEAQRRKGAEEEEEEGVVVQYSVMLLRED